MGKWSARARTTAPAYDASEHAQTTETSAVDARRRSDLPEVLPRATSIQKIARFHNTRLRYKNNARRSSLPRRAQNPPHATSVAKQTPTRKHIFAQERRHIKPTLSRKDAQTSKKPASESNAS